MGLHAGPRIHETRVSRPRRLADRCGLPGHEDSRVHSDGGGVAVAGVFHRRTPPGNHRHRLEQQPRSAPCGLECREGAGDYGIQRAELWPSVNAAGSGSRERVPADLSTTGSARTNERYDVNMGISSWEIDFFGRIRSLKDRALEEYLATDQARRSAQILLVSAVANTYLALAADRENLKLAAATLETQEASYKLIRKRHDVGLASELDLRQAQSQVDAARGDVARYTQLAAQDENALNLLVGSSLPPTLLPADLGGVEPLQGDLCRPLLRTAPAPAGRAGGGTSAQGGQRQYRRRPCGFLSPHLPDGGPRNRQRRSVRALQRRLGNVELRTARSRCRFSMPEPGRPTMSRKWRGKSPWPNTRRRSRQPSGKWPTPLPCRVR